MSEPPSKQVQHSTWSPSRFSDPGVLSRVKRLPWEMLPASILLAVAWVAVLVVTWMRPSLVRLMPWLVWGTTLTWLRIRLRGAPPHLSDLVDLPGAFSQFPVEVTYKTGPYTYGFDAGIVSFVDGWMHFRGHRTSWAITPDTVKVLDLGSKNLRRIHWREVDGRCHEVSVWPIDKIGGIPGQLRVRFLEALDEWKDKSTSSQAHVVLPPKTPDPESRSSLWASLRALDPSNIPFFVGLVLLSPVLAKEMHLHVYLVVLSGAASLFSIVIVQYVAYNMWMVRRMSGGSLVTPKRTWLSELKRRPFLAYSNLVVSKSSPMTLSAISLGEGPCPVRVTYLAQNVPYASDAGLLTLGEGILSFTGDLGGWTLCAHDVNVTDRWALNWWIPRGVTYVVRSKVDESREIRISPASSVAGIGRELEEQIATRMNDWANSDAEPSATSSNPRFEVSPDVVGKLNRSYDQWTRSRKAFHVLWPSALLCAALIFPKPAPFVLDVCVSGLAGLGLLLAREQRMRIKVKLKVFQSHLDLNTNA